MANEETVAIDPNTDGIRLDKLLAQLPSVGSREKARRALKSGKVSVDGTLVGESDAGRALRSGTRVAIAWNQPGTGPKWVKAREQLDRAGVSIVYQDADLVVTNKPAGLLTDAADASQSRTEDTLRKRVSALVGAEVWPAHRIDRNTTGIVAFVLSEAAKEVLKAQWIAQRPERVYLVVVEGAFRSDEGKFADYMAWDVGARLQRPAHADTPGAWLAQAHYRVVERYATATQLEVSLVTGRRNQIRLHTMLRDHPLVGELLYRLNKGPGIPFGRQALHARRLVFDHPRTGEPIAFEAPIPPDLLALLERLRRR